MRQVDLRRGHAGDANTGRDFNDAQDPTCDGGIAGEHRAPDAMGQDADGLRRTCTRNVILVRESWTDHQWQSQRLEEPFADTGDQQIGGRSTRVDKCDLLRRLAKARGAFDWKRIPQETEVER